MPPPPPDKTPERAAPVQRTSTMEKCWEALNRAEQGKPAEEIEKIWFKTIAGLFPNRSNSDLKPHEWGQLEAEFEDNIAM